MSANLIVVDGVDRGRIFAIPESDPLLVGRGQSSSTWLQDPFVSRVHFVIQPEGDRYVLLDAGSSSGVKVNGQRVSQRDLASGDTIEIGETKLEFALEVNLEAAPPALTTTRRIDPKQANTKRLAELVGQRFHNYELQRMIATGTTGVVFGGVDTGKDRPIAIKVLWPELTQDDGEVQRFIRAMRTMLPLRHENLVRVHGAGKSKRHCWVAMEYVPGTNLTEIIEQIGIAGMLDWRYAFRVMTQVARALIVAHEQKIIHRNITPKNILIRDEDKVAKLGDLMLAKALSGTMAQSVTRPGQLVGELAYMAPEATTATTDAEVDARADLYNLGATGYALLTGRPPFEGSQLVEMIQRIRTERPAAPSTFQMSVFAQFEAVIMKLLEKDPDHRFQSAKELLAALEQIAAFQGLSV